MGRDAIEPLPRRFAPSTVWQALPMRWPLPTSPGAPRTPRTARRRLAFEELFLHQVALAARRKGREDKRPGVPLDPPARADPERGSPRSRSSRPTGQRQAFAEIDEDLASGRPMQRLLMGEVGSRQDGGRPVRDAPRGRVRPPGGADGADRDARRAARAHPQRPPGLDPHPVHAPHGRDEGGGAPRRARTARDRRAQPDRRHPRPDRAGRPLRAARGLRRRRAAPLRRQAARGARREGPRTGRRHPRGAARPPHDRDADPADALADGVRRPGRDDASRASRRPPAGEDLGGGRGEARGRVRIRARAAARGAPGVLRLPARRGLGEAGGQGGVRGGRAPGEGGDARLPRRAPPRPDALARQGGGDGGIRRRARRTCSSRRA